MAAAAATYGTTPAPSAPAQKSKVEVFAPFVAEFVGTFVLVLTMGFCCLAPAAGAWAATAVGGVLVVMLYSTGAISGGNLNPAATFSLALVGVMKWNVVRGLLLVQLVAGLAAGVVCSVIFASQRVEVGPKMGYSSGNAFVAELLYSTMMCLVVNCCIASKRRNPKNDSNQFYALAIGFVAVAGGYAVGPISGGFFNPAAALGFGFSSHTFGRGLVYALAEFLGGLVAAGFHRLARVEEHFLPEAGLAEYKPMRMARFVSEFLGTFMLVLTMGSCIVNDSAATAWASAAALMCMTYALGDISGGHFNPAVTLAVLVSGRDKCSPRDGLANVSAQLLAALCAGSVYGNFRGAPNVAPQEGLGFSMKQAGFSELFFTALLSYTVLSCVTAARPETWVTRQNFYSGLAVGASYMAGSIATSALAGGRLNPAVSVGIAVGSRAHGGEALPFWRVLALGLFELAGGLLAAAAFRATHAAEFSKAPPLGK